MTPKRPYRTRNWKEYNKGLIQRGSLTVWFDEETLGSWYSAPEGKNGRPQKYSAQAIACGLTLAALFRLSLRSTQGFVQSLLILLKLPLSCPHYTTLSRRAATLNITLPVMSTSEPIHVVVDSTGLKVYGEGEWKVRMHGYGCRRTWRKLHVGVNENTGEIVSSALTSSKTHDSEALADLLNSIENPLIQVSADGAYV